MQESINTLDEYSTYEVFKLTGFIFHLVGGIFGYPAGLWSKIMPFNPKYTIKEKVVGKKEG